MKKLYNKSLAVFTLILGVMFIFSGCEKEGIKESFTGSWSASQNSLNGNIYTGNIGLKVEEDGSFILSDGTGNVSMQGKLTVTDEKNLELNCESEGFVTPLCWGATENDQYVYEFITEDVVVIGYNGNSIAFFRNVENVILEELKYENWITNNGLETEEITYRVSMTNNEISIYILDGDQIVRILYGRNLKYDSENKQISFVPDTSVGFDPPYSWYSEMGNNIQEVILDVKILDNYLTLSYNDIPLTFYNDLMYMMESDTDIYQLFDNTWVYQSGIHTYEIDFAFGDTVFVSCVDEEEIEYFYGAALIDESQTKMDLYVDLKTQTTELWGGIAPEMSMTYNLSGGKLILNHNGQSIELTAK